MAKRKTHSAAKPSRKDASLRITLNTREIDKKIRKVQPPVAKIHRSQKSYSRKQKHPKRAEE
jgi:hypothetical protein